MTWSAIVDDEYSDTRRGALQSRKICTDLGAARDSLQARPATRRAVTTRTTATKRYVNLRPARSRRGLKRMQHRQCACSQWPSTWSPLDHRPSMSICPACNFPFIAPVICVPSFCFHPSSVALTEPSAAKIACTCIGLPFDRNLHDPSPSPCVTSNGTFQQIRFAGSCGKLQTRPLYVPSSPPAAPSGAGTAGDAWWDEKRPRSPRQP